MALPRVPLAHLPTPLEPAPRLGAALGLELLVKREDLSGLALGGNKVRQLEVILGEALRVGARTIVTTAGAQSNFCRAMAGACARLGLGCILLLRGDGGASVTGNLLLQHLFGAEIHWIDTADPYDPRVRARLDELAAAAPEPFVVQLPSATGPLAAAAAVGLADELAGQWTAPPEAVVIATGSGLTAAGLLAGLDGPTRVLAVSVQQPESFIRPLILRRAREAAELLGRDLAIHPLQLMVDDRAIGEGYGLPSRESLEAVTLAARCEGLVLDPAYSGKALAGLVRLARQGAIGRDGPVVFVHSGGAPNLFAASAAIAAHLAAGQS